MNDKTETVFQRIIGFIVLRMQEMSTWRGVVLVLSATGSAIQPQYTEAIIAGGMLVAGLLGMIFPDAVKKAKETIKEEE
jgi:hypothetical protein